MSLPRARIVSRVGVALVVAAALLIGTSIVMAQKPAGAGGPVSALQVVDSGGAVVGVLVDYQLVAMKVGSIRIGVPVVRDRIPTFGFSTSYTSLDCSGSAFLPADYALRQAFSTGAGPSATAVFYAANPVQNVTVNSTQPVNADGSLESCIQYSSPVTILAGPAATINVSFTPPFDVQ
jgi:hypothetical protein